MRSLILLLLIASCACAIVFVPPAIYVVTLSIGAFLTNAFIFLAAWLAVSGLLDRKLFGKRPHELIKGAFSFIGKAFVFISCALLSVLIISPVTPIENMQAASLSGAAALVLFFLGGYRILLLNENKGKMLFSLSVCALLTAGGTYVSVVLAQETKVIHTKGSYEKKDMTASAPSMADISMEYEPAGLNKLDTTGSSGYLFYPLGPAACSIFYGHELIRSVTPKDNCYYAKDGQAQRMYCPIEIPKEDLPGGKGILTGRGSCTEAYAIE